MARSVGTLRRNHTSGVGGEPTCHDSLTDAFDPHRTSQATTVPDRWDRLPPRLSSGIITTRLLSEEKNVPEDLGATPTAGGGVGVRMRV
jgi:hypothetical protein